jgi:AraC-like DNA-binding protein
MPLHKKHSPAVCQAGNFQFSSGQMISSPCIQSRGWLWCKSGRGKMQLNGQTLQLAPADMWLLPWNRRIIFQADARDPLFIGMVHLVPDWRPSGTPVFAVPHNRENALYNSPERSDAKLDGVPDEASMHLGPATPLAHLMSYIITWFRRGRRDMDVARQLAVLLLRETAISFKDKLPASGDLPPLLQRAMIYVERCHDESPTVGEVAHSLQRSESHVLKLFKRHLGTTVKGYIIDTQIRAACEYLAGSNLTMAEVGQRVGIPDPYHFSRAFRQRMNCTPSKYREIHLST